MALIFLRCVFGWRQTLNVATFCAWLGEAAPSVRSATLTPVSGSYIGLISGIKRLNAGIRQLADEEGAYLVDLEKALAWDPAYLLADGLHPNAMGNVIMAAEFYDILH